MSLLDYNDRHLLAIICSKNRLKIKTVASKCSAVLIKLRELWTCAVSINDPFYKNYLLLFLKWWINSSTHSSR